MPTPPGTRRDTFRHSPARVMLLEDEVQGVRVAAEACLEWGTSPLSAFPPLDCVENLYLRFPGFPGRKSRIVQELTGSALPGEGVKIQVPGPSSVPENLCINL